MGKSFGKKTRYEKGIDPMGKQHFIFGELTDFITGKPVADTDDERDRQKIAKYLVRDKGFSKADIEAGVKLPVAIDEDSDTVSIDFTIRLQKRVVMIVKYGPGSIVSRERPALSAARLLEPYIIPHIVVTNGQDVIIMDAYSGKIVGKGFEKIPSRSEIESQLETIEFLPLEENRVDKEKRILFCMEVLSNRDCECDRTC
jgi:Type I restriction enzyme R protein N terminus (HSDR_N)